MTHPLGEYFGTFLFAGGFAAGVRDMVRGRRSRGWPTAPGEILHSELRSWWGRCGRTYKAWVTYTYRVGGRLYSGDRIIHGGFTYTFWGRGVASAIVAKYPTGSSVQVRYDPASPNKSVFEPGVERRTVIETLIWGAVALSMAYVFFIAAA